MSASVRTLTRETAAVITVEATIQQTIWKLLDCDAEELLVIQQSGYLSGIVTATELFKANLAGKDLNDCVSSIMHTAVMTIPSTMSLAQAVKLFRERQHQRVIVLENGKLLGTLCCQDMMRSQLQFDTRIEMKSSTADTEPTALMRGPRFCKLETVPAN